MKNKGTGRKKIEMKAIQNLKYRRVCFCKRRDGMFQKAAQLSKLTGCGVAALAFSTTKKPHLYGDIKLLEQAAEALAAAGSHTNKPSASSSLMIFSDFQGMGLSPDDDTSLMEPLQTVLSTNLDENCYYSSYGSPSSSGSFGNYYEVFGDQRRLAGSSSGNSNIVTSNNGGVFTTERILAPEYPTWSEFLLDEAVENEDDKLNKLIQDRQRLEFMRDRLMQNLTGAGAQNSHTQDSSSSSHLLNGSPPGGF